MPHPSIRPLIWLVCLSTGLVAGPAWSDGAPRNIEIGAQQTKAGHAFHYMQILNAKEVAIVVAWPHDWIERGGAVAVPYVGQQLMLNGGAGDRDAAALAADFQDLNAVGNLVATADNVIGVLRAAPKHLAKAADIGRDVLVSPHLDDRWRKRLQQTLKANQLQKQQELSTATWDSVRRFVLGDGSLNDFLTLQPSDLIDDVTLADIETWHAESFTIDGIEIAAAGPLDPVVVADAIDRLLDGLPAKAPGSLSAAKTTSAAPRFVGKTILLHKPNVEKAMVAVIGPIPSAHEPDALLDMFASHTLGVGKQARLFDAIRTKLRASYSPGAGIHGYGKDIRIIYLHSEADEQRLEEVYGAFHETYETLRNDGMTSEELERVKEDLVAIYVESRKRPEEMAPLLVDFLVYDNPLIDRFGEIPEMIEAITLDEVNTALRERLPAFDNMVRIVTTSKDDAVEADCVITSVAEIDRCHD